MLIQDADLENNPQDYPTLIRPIVEGSPMLFMDLVFLNKSTTIIPLSISAVICYQ